MANLFSLEGKNAWVTGGCYGIGFAIAKAFVQAGAKNIIFNARSQEAIDKHHATPMMNKIAELRNKYDLHMRVERFIEDDTIPEQDQNFIRK